MLDQATMNRLHRGLTGVASGLMRIVSRMSSKAPYGNAVLLWEIESKMTSKGATYFVGYKPATGEWRCTCPDFQKRGQPCKHILMCQVYHQQRVEV